MINTELDLDSFGQKFEKEKKEREAGDFYKIKEGAQKVRILTPFVGVWALNTLGKYVGIFNGTDAERERMSNETQVDRSGKDSKKHSFSFKGWAWAIVRGSDGDELKIVQLSKTVLHQIYSLKKDEEYSFDKYPMPYDITINAVGAGTTSVQYSTVPSARRVDVTPEEMAKLNKKKTIPDIITAIIDKQEGRGAQLASREGMPVADEQINPDDIPF